MAWFLQMLGDVGAFFAKIIAISAILFVWLRDRSAIRKEQAKILRDLEDLKSQPSCKDCVLPAHEGQKMEYLRSIKAEADAIHDDTIHLKARLNGK